MHRSLFWVRFLQPERRIHLRETRSEMATASYILYGGGSITGLIALQVPLWPEINILPIYIVCLVTLAAAVLFYVLRKDFPLPVAILHPTVGILLVGIALYAARGPESAVIGTFFVLSSIYSFHFLTLFFSSLYTILAAMVYISVATIYAWDGWEAQSIIFFGCFFTVGLTVSSLMERINRLATRDSLTGLYNRHTWDLLLDQELSSLDRGSRPICVMLIDLNYFKRINDTRGHLAGDQILQEVASGISDVIRRGDVAARWGGDEFIILMRGCALDCTSLLEERLKRRLGDIVTFTAGVAQLSSCDTEDSLLQRADEMLYQRKQMRRPEASSMPEDLTVFASGAGR